MIGRPKTRYEMIGRCEVCRDRTRWLTSDARPVVKRTCSPKCRMVLVRATRMKCPNAATLRTLYVRERLSTPQIAAKYDTDARTVNSALRKAGIEIRRKTVVTRCQIDGCQNFPKKIRHTNNGAEYGTLCADHRKAHRTGLARDYWKREGEVITLQRGMARAGKSPKVLPGQDLAGIFDIEIAPVDERTL